MNVVVYLRTHPGEPEASEGALAAQQAAVTAWLSAHDAIATLEYVEVEGKESTKARPQFGRALATCREHGAVLLVAMTNAIGTGEPFGPFHGSLGGSVRDVWCYEITHPEPERPATPPALEPMSVVAYYRTRPAELATSDAALAEQRAAVAAWCTAHPHASVLAEHVEAEQAGDSRPALAAAVVACKAAGASLLIANSEAIGTGEPFRHRISSVPVKVIRDPSRWAPESILLPANAPDGLCLLFRPNGSSNLAVYVCNPGSGTLSQVVVTSGGVTMDVPDVPLTTSAPCWTFDTIAPGEGRRVGRYDPMWDGDFLVWYEISYKDTGGNRRGGRATVDKGGPRGCWLPIKTANA